MNDDAVLRVRGLRTELGGRPVLAGVDLEAARGKVLAVVGPSGAGKTTLLRALNYLTPFSAGEVVVSGLRLRPGMCERRQVRKEMEALEHHAHLPADGSERRRIRPLAHPGPQAEPRDDHLSGGERRQVVEGAEERRLSRSRGADDGEHLAARSTI